MTNTIIELTVLEGKGFNKAVIEAVAAKANEYYEESRGTGSYNDKLIGGKKLEAVKAVVALAAEGNLVAGVVALINEIKSIMGTAGNIFKQQALEAKIEAVIEIAALFATNEPTSTETTVEVAAEEVVASEVTEVAVATRKVRKAVPLKNYMKKPEKSKTRKAVPLKNYMKSVKGGC